MLHPYLTTYKRPKPFLKVVGDIEVDFAIFPLRLLPAVARKRRIESYYILPGIGARGRTFIAVSTLAGYLPGQFKPVENLFDLSSGNMPFAHGWSATFDMPSKPKISKRL
jgi:hypothetical protein